MIKENIEQLFAQSDLNNHYSGLGAWYWVGGWYNCYRVPNSCLRVMRDLEFQNWRLCYRDKNDDISVMPDIEIYSDVPVWIKFSDNACKILDVEKEYPLTKDNLGQILAVELDDVWEKDLVKARGWSDYKQLVIT